MGRMPALRQGHEGEGRAPVLRHGAPDPVSQLEALASSQTSTGEREAVMTARNARLVIVADYGPAARVTALCTRCRDRLTVNKSGRLHKHLDHSGKRCAGDPREDSFKVHERAKA